MRKPDKSPAYDPEARRRFDIEAALVGSFKMFTVASRDPKEVAEAIDPIVRRRQLENAERLIAWLRTLASHLKQLREHERVA